MPLSAFHAGIRSPFTNWFAKIGALCVHVHACLSSTARAASLESGKGALLSRAYYPEGTAARHFWHSGPWLMKCLVRVYACVCGGVCVGVEVCRVSHWGVTFNSTFSNHWIGKCIQTKSHMRTVTVMCCKGWIIIIIIILFNRILNKFDNCHFSLKKIISTTWVALTDAK